MFYITPKGEGVNIFKILASMVGLCFKFLHKKFRNIEMSIFIRQPNIPSVNIVDFVDHVKVDLLQGWLRVETFEINKHSKDIPNTHIKLIKKTK